MNRDNGKSWFSFVGAVAIVVSVVFLGAQIQQDQYSAWAQEVSNVDEPGNTEGIHMASKDSSSISKQSRELASNMVGVWWLQSRTDVAADGSARVEPTLGSDPLGILTYKSGRFAAQFMKRDRSNSEAAENSVAGENNTRAVGGYDAYFGNYEVDEVSGDVIHRLEGALNNDNVGLEVSRTLQVEGDRLTIQLETTTADGESVTRTLTWERIK